MVRYGSGKAGSAYLLCKAMAVSTHLWIFGGRRQKMLFFHDMDAKIAMIFRFGIAERAPTDILGESSCIMVECRKQGRPSLLGSKPFLSDDGTGMS